MRVVIVGQLKVLLYIIAILVAMAARGGRYKRAITRQRNERSNVQSSFLFITGH
jgi:hypothetical protein